MTRARSSQLLSLAAAALVLIGPSPMGGPAALQAQALTVPYTQFTLPNGLNVILHRDTSVPVVAVNLWYHVGSSHERPGRTGFAHLFEHIMFEGSMHVPEGSFDTWLEAAGANNNGSTTTDRTNYYIDLPANALDLALFLESDRMATLRVDEATFKQEREVVKEERRMRIDNQPYGRLQEILYDKAFEEFFGTQPPRRVPGFPVI